MKKILLISFFYLSVLASDKYELQLYKTIFPVLFEKSHLVVYVQDKEHFEMFSKSSIFSLAKDCEEADFLFGKNFQNLKYECREKAIFSTSYRSFKNTENSFGAFYWRKGRPQIKFKLDAVKRYDLYLPHSLQEYAR